MAGGGGRQVRGVVHCRTNVIRLTSAGIFSAAIRERLVDRQWLLVELGPAGGSDLAWEDWCFVSLRYNSYKLREDFEVNHSPLSTCR